MAIPVVIQDMFPIIKRSYPDLYQRNNMYNVVRCIIAYRDRNVSNSCRLDVLFAQRDRLKSVIGQSVPEVGHAIDEVFRLAGYISPPMPAIETPPFRYAYAPVHPEPERTAESNVVNVPRELRSLEIHAEGFDSVIIHFGNGKKVVVQV
jgi:hypothetical protein